MEIRSVEKETGAEIISISSGNNNILWILEQIVKLIKARGKLPMSMQRTDDEFGTHVCLVYESDERTKENVIQAESVEEIFNRKAEGT